MADRLTQLQDAVNQQADNFTNSLGILQQFACPTPFSGLNNNSSHNNNSSNNASSAANNHAAVITENGNVNKSLSAAAAAAAGAEAAAAAAAAAKTAQQQQQQQQHEDHTNLFSQLIARTAKDIELLIDSLPSEESSADLQATSLQALERENEKAALQLQDVVNQGEATLKEIQSALHDLAQAQLAAQNLEAK